MEECMQNNTFPPFIMMCLMGSKEGCLECLLHCKTDEEKHALLETRHSFQRFSAIFFPFIGQRVMQIQVPIKQDYIGVVKLLIDMEQELMREIYLVRLLSFMQPVHYVKWEVLR